MYIFCHIKYSFFSFYRKQTTSADSAISMAGIAAGKPPLTAKSPVKPPPRPKSRVRDTIKLFDAKYNKTPYRNSTSAAMPAIKPSAAVAATSGERGGTGRGGSAGMRTTPSGGSNTGARLRSRATTVASPKTGGGEGLAGDGGM